MKLKTKLLVLGIFLCGLLQHAIAQNLTITGIVKSNVTGRALQGVTILNQKTKKSTLTNESGNFTITAQKGNTLLFTYIGMAVYTFEVSRAGSIEITMEEDVKKMDEVVVIGYGTQKVTKVSGAISTIKSADLEKLKPVRAEDALQGRASGVTVITAGSPGAKPTVFIRGIPSYKGSDPLVVVDGSIQTLDDLNSINSADIESINVLKDAATTAIYGVSGGNGVILVTTKAGRKNKKTEFNYSSNYGIQQVARRIGVLNATEYAAIINEGQAADGNAIVFTDLSKLGVGTNWQDQIFKNAPLQSHSVTARGGGENVTYFVSGAYTGQGGIVGGADKSYFDRYNATTNVSFDLSSKLKLVTNTSFVNIKGATVPENAINSVISNALNFDPTVPIYNNIPGTYGKYSISNNILREIFNPLTQLDDTHNYSNTNKLYGKVELQYQVLNNLKLTSRYGYTNTDITGKSFGPLVYYGDNHNGSTLNADGTTKGSNHNGVSQYKNTYYNYTFETFSNYNFKINRNHIFETVLGFSMAKVTGNATSASRQDVPNNSWEFADFTSATGNSSNGGIGAGAYKFEKRNLSYFSRVNYDYKERYLASASLRKDGSYEFGTNNKFGYFYAGSLGWVTSAESFYKLKLIDYLKIRGSYGVIGNDNVDHPQYLQIYTGIYEYGQGNNTGYVFNDAPVNGSTLSTYANNSLKWERQKQLNIGFDARLIKNKVSISFDYYEKRTSGLLFNPTLSLYLGTAASPSANVGTTKTSGIDMNIGYTELLSKSFKFSTNATFTTSKNLVTYTNNGIITGGNYGIPNQSITRFQTGYAPGYFYGYKAIGIFQTQDEIAKSPTQPNAQPGDIKYADVNGNGVIDDSDRTQIGNPFPKFTAGWNLSLEYKGFDFNIFIYGSYGNDIYRAYERNLAETNKYRGVLARWTGPGTTNNPKNPRVTFKDPNNNTRASDRYLQDGSFIKIKDLQLGYVIPAHLYKNVFSKIRVYVQVKNLLTLTKYDGFDPEIAGGIFDTNIDRGAYPQARIYSMGIDCKF
ncbi:SusC/RagA family TonB-linked outer membrane protein [Parasediminibacterium sp. JCM 36343]|uniref:SusC/RagA family TonB-linked outer membrane protein n=1 Tax=Parasediminibacterium sp. JCM 36343 TaxID=3374279 RepID=UPI00397D26BB